jgi:hypothetical protein
MKWDKMNYVVKYSNITINKKIFNFISLFVIILHYLKHKIVFFVKELINIYSFIIQFRLY